MNPELVTAVIQMTSVDDVEVNFQQIENLMAQAFTQGQPRLVCFPENCLYMRLVEGEKIHGFSLQDDIFSKLGALAKRYRTYLHLGSIPLLVEGHLYNSSVLITPEGVAKHTYQKMHLFDIHLENQKPIRESDVFRHGHQPNIIEIDGWRIGESICYDIRFAELFSQYARKEVDLILIPAAFLTTTGEAHWEILLRARAIESQAYLIASAQAGIHTSPRGGRRETHGHSLVVSPWGDIAAQVRTRDAGVTLCTLKKEKIESVRRQIPMKFHRRIPV